MKKRHREIIILHGIMNAFFIAKLMCSKSPIVVAILISNIFESSQDLIFVDINLLYLFFQRLKSAATEKEEDTIYHARCVITEAKTTLFFLINVLDLCLLSYYLPSIISAIEYANTSMSVGEITLHEMMTLSYIYIVE